MTDEHNPSKQNKRNSRLTVLFLLLAFVGVAFAVTMRQQYLKANEQIAWTKDYDKGLTEAKNQNMPVMLEFTSRNCSACTAMKTQVFSDKAIGDIVNTTVIPVRLDISEMDVEQANKLANQYNIWATPTYVMLSPTGQVVGRSEGAMPKDDFNQWVQLTAQQATSNSHSNASP
ncbi:thioredoxin family protein [Planctomycetota bacterium]|nr:thioredoxin family protein [Planctomycetota bacterium]